MLRCDVLLVLEQWKYTISRFLPIAAGQENEFLRALCCFAILPPRSLIIHSEHAEAAFPATLGPLLSLETMRLFNRKLTKHYGLWQAKQSRVLRDRRVTLGARISRRLQDATESRGVSACLLAGNTATELSSHSLTLTLQVSSELVNASKKRVHHWSQIWTEQGKRSQSYFGCSQLSSGVIFTFMCYL